MSLVSKGRALLLLMLVVVLSLSACLRPRIGPAEKAERAKKVEDALNEATDRMRIGSDQELDLAWSLLTLGLELAPGDPRIYDGLGCVAWRKGNRQLAEQYFEQSVAVDPFYDRGYAHLAFAAEKKGLLDRAEELYRTALGLNPLDFQCRNNYAVFLARKAHSETQLKRSYHELLMANQSAKEEILPAENLSKIRRGLSFWPN